MTLILLTRSVCSKWRRLFENEAEVSATKQKCQHFLLFSLLLCTNAQCSMPFHTIVTEAIICNRGMQELVMKHQLNSYKSLIVLYM